ADNSARSVYGEQLALSFSQFTKGERGTGVWRLRDAAFRRLYRLILRLGRPPSHRAVFDQWLVRVRERAKVMHEELVAAFTNHDAELKGLERVFARLSAEENWLGAHFGLRVCSSNGPARPPARRGRSYTVRT